MDLWTKTMRDDGYALEDTLLYAGVETAAGSKILEGFTPLFSATCARRLQKAGYVCRGKAAVSEFGLGMTGGAAALVADGTVPFALHVDSNGAPSRAAAAAAVTYCKPTYGVVSRYGVIPCACSSETVGVTAKTAAGCAEILSVIAGHDPNDGTSLPAEQYDFNADGEVRGLRIALLRDYAEAADDGTRQKLQALASALQDAGACVTEVDFPQARAAQIANFILLCGETCNNLSRYDGVKFGYRTPKYRDIDALYTGTRTEGFTFLSKAIILYGSDVLSKNRYLSCYDKALRVRTVLLQTLQALFAEYDLLLLPACSENARRGEETVASVYAESFFTALANITGLPAITTGGVCLLADRLCENKLFAAARAGEEACI